MLYLALHSDNFIVVIEYQRNNHVNNLVISTHVRKSEKFGKRQLHLYALALGEMICFAKKECTECGSEQRVEKQYIT